MEESKAKIYWAVNLKKIFLRELEETIDIITKDDAIRNVVIEFIPEQFIMEMEEQGFTIISEFIDFWINCLDDVYLEQSGSLNIRRIRENEYQAVSDITIACKDYSRGFIGETPEWMREWNESENSCIFVAEIDSEIVGMCCVSLWLREIAVKPNNHSQRIGLNLMTHAINWGKSQGAVRSFLASDVDNDKAIKLYERLGYVRKTGRGQINMGSTIR